MMVQHSGIDWSGKYKQIIETKGRQPGHVDFESVSHLIVLPNYKEALETLRETLDVLASHRYARSSYSIVLAMEEAEAGSTEKAQQLIKLYQNSFSEIIFTLHPAGLPGEARGKSSNVSWAVSQACKGVFSSNVVVTVLDADIHFNEDYFAQVAYNFCLATSEERERMMFTPPMVFDRNSQDVPALVRMADILWSMCVTSNYSATESSFKFPCSAYGVSIDLVRFVGFWDSGPEAMGEDLHMFLKCFFATQGRLITKAIWSPASCSNVSGPTYISSLAMRYSQAKRHLWGSLDLAYSLEQLIMRKVKPPFLITLALFHRLHEMHLLFAHLFVMIWLSTWIPVENPMVQDVLYIAKWMRNLCIIPGLMMGISYERYHYWVCSHSQKASKALRTWISRLDWVLAPVTGFTYVFLPQVYAHTMQLFTNRLDYVVSAKPTSGLLQDIDVPASEAV